MELLRAREWEPVATCTLQNRPISVSLSAMASSPGLPWPNPITEALSAPGLLGSFPSDLQTALRAPPCQSGECARLGLGGSRGQIGPVDSFLISLQRCLPGHLPDSRLLPGTQVSPRLR